MCKMDLSFWYSNCCESTKKLKDPFVKVESICLFVPIVVLSVSGTLKYADLGTA